MSNRNLMTQVSHVHSYQLVFFVFIGLFCDLDIFIYSLICC